MNNQHEAGSILTPDIRPEWETAVHQILDVIRRLQSVGKSRGCAVLTIRVLVDADGVPRYWGSPQVTKFEPGSDCDPDRVLDIMCGCNDT